MTVYVDSAQIPHRGKLRSHMTADSLAELHEFAVQIGVKKCWFHKGRTHPHYDVCEAQRAQAIGAGAKVVTARHILRVAKSLVSGRS